MLTINLSEIEQALSTLFEALRRREGDTIELGPVDYYWAIGPEELYAPYQEPTHLTLGQLSDDLEEISRVAQGEAPPVGLDLVKLSAILAAIGHMKR